MATVPNFTDLTKLPPKATSFVNDTMLKAPKVPKADFGTRAGKFVKPLVPFARAIPGVGTALAVGGTLMSDVDQAPEDRTFPKAGAVADETRRLQGEADGFIAREKEGLKGALPLVGGLMTDVYDRVSNFYGDGPDLGPGIEHTPGAAEALANPSKAPVVPPVTPAATGPATTSGSKYDDLLLAQLGGQGQPEAAPAAPTVKPNDSYFINNQTGEAPGEKQYFRDLPGTTLNDPQPQSQPGLPQRLPTAQGQNSAYESPMVAATKNLNLAQFDGHKDSFGDLLSKRLHNVNEGGKLIPALAQTKEAEEQQRRSEVDREFGLESLTQEQDNKYNTNTLALGRDELTGMNRRSNLDNLVRLRNTDVVSETSKANALVRGAATANKPRTPKQQLEDQNANIELDYRAYPNAPEGFVDEISTLMSTGASREQIQAAYKEVVGLSIAAGRPENELDPRKLAQDVAAELSR